MTENNKIILRKKQFVRFLKENNCYKEFFHYFYNSKLNSHFYDNNDRTIEQLITVIMNNNYNSYNEVSLAFVWKDTIEGYAYWYAVFEKWDKILMIYRRNEKSEYYEEYEIK